MKSETLRPGTEVVQIGVAPVHVDPGPVPKCAVSDQAEATPDELQVRTRQK